MSNSYGWALVSNNGEFYGRLGDGGRSIAVPTGDYWKHKPVLAASGACRLKASSNTEGNTQALKC